MLAPETGQIGKVKLHELTAADVRMALAEAATSRATRTVQAAHSALVRAITPAQANDLVARNVAALIRAPKGQQGRPWKSLTLTQAHRVLTAAEGSRLHGYIALCLLTGAERRRPARSAGITWTWTVIRTPPLPCPRT